MTTETVSRSFIQLKKGGLIRIENSGRVTLLDRDALDEIAEGF